MQARARAGERGLAPALEAAVGRAFCCLRKPVRNNLVVLTRAFLSVLSAARGGNGYLSLKLLSRVLPTLGTPHAREKRLHRFLDNQRLDPRGVTDGLATLIVGRRGKGLWPILFDQTQSGSTQALVAGVPFRGRALPLSIYTFDYPWGEAAAKSQNHLEHVFLLDLAASLPKEVAPVFIGDRGYARAVLLRQSLCEERLFILRGRGGTRVLAGDRPMKLKDLPCGGDKAMRHTGVLYQAQERVPVDVVAIHDPTFSEPWYLLVPPDSEVVLPTQTVVALYRERMKVEQSFRDFKTHLGLRGLRLKVRTAPRTGRLLLAFCLAYALALLLGISAEAQQAQAALEILRRTPRHGTRRTLSCLSLAMQMLSHPSWRSRALGQLVAIVLRLARGHPLLARAPRPLRHRLPSVA